MSDVFVKDSVQLNIKSIVKGLHDMGYLNRDDCTLIKFGMLPKAKFEFVSELIQERAASQLKERNWNNIKKEWVKAMEFELTLALFKSVKMIA